MNQTYLAAVPAIGYVQVWFSPAQDRLPEKMFGVAPLDRAAEAVHAPSEKSEDAAASDPCVMKQRRVLRHQRRG
jgi:hypothetical protein